MKIEKKKKKREFTFSATFSLPSPSSDLKVPVGWSWWRWLWWWWKGCTASQLFYPLPWTLADHWFERVLYASLKHCKDWTSTSAYKNIPLFNSSLGYNLLTTWINYIFEENYLPLWTISFPRHLIKYNGQKCTTIIDAVTNLGGCLVCMLKTLNIGYDIFHDLYKT